MLNVSKPLIQVLNGRFWTLHLPATGNQNSSGVSKLHIKELQSTRQIKIVGWVTGGACLKTTYNLRLALNPESSRCEKAKQGLQAFACQMFPELLEWSCQFSDVS